MRVEFLEANRNAGYLVRPIPNERDAEIGALIQAYRSAKTAERSELRALVEAAHTPTLRCFAERMANLAVRTRSTDPSAVALIALGLAWPAEPDQREIWLVMAPVRDSIRRCGGDPLGVFGDVAALFPADVRAEIEAFAHRPDIEGTLSAMGYSPGQDSDGFRYHRNW